MFYFTYGKNKQNKLLRNAFFVDILEAAAKKSRILIRNPVYGFNDPDPYSYKLSNFVKNIFMAGVGLPCLLDIFLIVYLCKSNFNFLYF